MEEFRPLTPHELLDELKSRAADPHYFEEFKEPLKFTYNGITYTHVEDTAKFTTPRSKTEMTALAVMKEAEPTLTKSLYRKIEPPDELYKFAKATRRKITRLAQLHYCRPEIDDRVRSFVPFFNYLSNSKFMGGQFGISQHFAASLFAADYDMELATALILYYGWVPDFQIPMGGVSIHHIEKEYEGVTITVKRDHTLQRRLDTACERARTKIMTSIRAPNVEEVIKDSVPAFYSYKGTYISLPENYHSEIQGKMTAYIKELLTCTLDSMPSNPTIEDPADDEWLEDQVIYIAYADFLFQEELTTAQQNQREDANATQTKRALQEKLKGLPINEPIKRKEIFEYTNCDNRIDNNLKAGVKYGFLSKPKYGHYMILPSLFGKE